MLTDELLEQWKARAADEGGLNANKCLDLIETLQATRAELRRLRELERKRDKARFKLRRLEQAVKQVIYHRDYPHIGRHWFLRERATQNQVDAIGRLLEGEG